jgi:hypothetical protein
MERRDFLAAISSAIAGSLITPKSQADAKIEEPKPFSVRFGDSNPWILRSGEMLLSNYPNLTGRRVFFSGRVAESGGGTLQFYGNMAKSDGPVMPTELIFGEDRMCMWLIDYRVDYFPEDYRLPRPDVESISRSLHLRFDQVASDLATVTYSWPR